jgi:hypothetical protein
MPPLKINSTMRRSRNLPLPAGRLDYIIFVSGIKIQL